MGVASREFLRFLRPEVRVHVKIVVQSQQGLSAKLAEFPETSSDGRAAIIAEYARLVPEVEKCIYRLHGTIRFTYPQTGELYATLTTQQISDLEREAAEGKLPVQFVAVGEIAVGDGGDL